MNAQAQVKLYAQLIDHYEDCLARHGDSHRGVDWPNPQDAATRYQVMLDVIRSPDKTISLLDFGCGAGHLCEYIQAQKLSQIKYAGLDLSAQFVTLATSKFPAHRFYQTDILAADAAALPSFDYIVLNGVLTEKLAMSFNEMWDYTQRLLRAVFAMALISTNLGVSFWVLSVALSAKRAIFAASSPIRSRSVMVLIIINTTRKSPAVG